jgi:hypothetical protein
MLVVLDATIRVDFGDKAHGQLVSRVHVADDHKVPVKIEELVAAIKSSTVKKHWGTAASTLEDHRMPHGYLDNESKKTLHGKIVRVISGLDNGTVILSLTEYVLVDGKPEPTEPFEVSIIVPDISIVADKIGWGNDVFAFVEVDRYLPGVGFSGKVISTSR